MVEYISLRARTRRSRALHGSIFASRVSRDSLEGRVNRASRQSCVSRRRRRRRARVRVRTRAPNVSRGVRTRAPARASSRARTRTMRPRRDSTTTRTSCSSDTARRRCRECASSSTPFERRWWTRAWTSGRFAWCQCPRRRAGKSWTTSWRARCRARRTRTVATASAR